ncbi:hypothetical protein [Flavobacterium sp. HTF]|uniref:hypothetical protein n=1 Tax=Flavobacterium sp. HTF TaxID=2170732 RepID=UPI000D5F6B2F|nr:hypothetical protein [Flavobacterium sp. HTF]PWB24735.1 hypothetical protein DCO46_10795 [Flavobacterium sp. HTF]
MKLSKLFFLPFIWVLFLGFKSVSVDSTVTKKSFYFVNDKQQLETLLLKTYEWVETKNSNNDFNPVANKKGDKYIGLNLKEHNKRLEELKKTNFFSQQFLDNYNKIALKIDANLKNKKIEWFVGDLPPFGNDANAWCDCQDNPEEYWKTLKINNLKIENDKASFSWTWTKWKDDSKYAVKAVKENGIWKIAYLEGFDYENLTKIYN